MILDDKPTSRIVSADIQALMASREEENAFLEYKRQPYPRTEYGAQEIIKDVSAFANAQGGYIIIGIAEATEEPRRPDHLVHIENAEAERTRMMSLCFEKIEPRLTELDIRSLVVDEKTLLLCRISEGANKPYCARPDREHHYFWRRWEDGNRLMSVPEIRECLEGDRVLRELAEIRREFSNIRQQQIVARESELEVDHNNVFQLQSDVPFRNFVDEQFTRETVGRAFYRLSATPLPINQVTLRTHAPEVVALMERPPEIRPHGWNLTRYLTEDGISSSALGLMRRDVHYKHIRVLWNAHVEFWTEVDDDFFRLRGGVIGNRGEVENKFLFPHALSEPVEHFVLFVREICRLVAYEGEVEFRLGFYGIRGLFLAPGHPESIGYRMARMSASTSGGPRSFPDNDLLAAPASIRCAYLPDQIAWRLVSDVYHRFGYFEDAQVPFFDNEHHLRIPG